MHMAQIQIYPCATSHRVIENGRNRYLNGFFFLLRVKATAVGLDVVTSLKRERKEAFEVTGLVNVIFPDPLSLDPLFWL